MFLTAGISLLLTIVVIYMSRKQIKEKVLPLGDDRWIAVLWRSAAEAVSIYYTSDNIPNSMEDISNILVDTKNYWYGDNIGNVKEAFKELGSDNIESVYNDVDTNDGGILNGLKKIASNSKILSEGHPSMYANIPGYADYIDFDKRFREIVFVIHFIEKVLFYVAKANYIIYNATYEISKYKEADPFVLHKLRSADFLVKTIPVLENIYKTLSIYNKIADYYKNDKQFIDEMKNKMDGISILSEIYNNALTDGEIDTEKVKESFRKIDSETLTTYFNIAESKTINTEVDKPVKVITVTRPKVLKMFDIEQ